MNGNVRCILITLKSKSRSNRATTSQKSQLLFDDLRSMDERWRILLRSFSEQLFFDRPTVVAAERIVHHVSSQLSRSERHSMSCSQGQMNNWFRSLLIVSTNAIIHPRLRQRVPCSCFHRSLPRKNQQLGRCNFVVETCLIANMSLISRRTEPVTSDLSNEKATDAKPLLNQNEFVYKSLARVATDISPSASKDASILVGKRLVHFKFDHGFLCQSSADSTILGCCGQWWRIWWFASCHPFWQPGQQHAP